MALTKVQADSVIRLFILSFASENDNQKRKSYLLNLKIFLEKVLKIGR